MKLDDRAGLRRRLDALAHEDPVEDGWEAIQRRIEVHSSWRRRLRRPIWASVAAGAVLIGCLQILSPREGGSTIDTVDDTTTTTEESPSTTETSTPPGTDISTPPGPSSDSEPAQDTTGSQVVSHGAGTPPSTTPATTVPDRPPEPSYEFSVSPSSPSWGHPVTISAVTPCPRPAWARGPAPIVVRIFRGEEEVVGASLMVVPDSGMWSITFGHGADQFPADLEPGDYEVRVVGDGESSEGFQTFCPYASRTFIVTAG